MSEERIIEVLIITWMSIKGKSRRGKNHALKPRSTKVSEESFKNIFSFSGANFISNAIAIDKIKDLGNANHILVPKNIKEALVLDCDKFHKVDLMYNMKLSSKKLETLYTNVNYSNVCYLGKYVVFFPLNHFPQVFMKKTYSYVGYINKKCSSKIKLTNF